MLESLQGHGMPGEFVISQRSGNVTLVPSWRNQLTPVLVFSPLFCQCRDSIRKQHMYAGHNVCKRHRQQQFSLRGSR